MAFLYRRSINYGFRIRCDLRFARLSNNDTLAFGRRTHASNETNGGRRRSGGWGPNRRGGGHGQFRGLWLAVTDIWVWWYAFALAAQVVALSFNVYFPTLTATLGYNTTVSLLLCAPPFIFAAIIAFFLSRFYFYFWYITFTDAFIKTFR